MNWILLTLIPLALIAIFVLKWLSFVPAEKARQLLRDRAVIVDVRSPGEFESGHLSAALNIPLGTLAGEAPRRIPDRDQAVLLHCLSGGRSEMARQQLKRLGYRNVFNLGSYARAEKIVRGAQQQ
jgi:phage shock protein E